MNTPFPPRVIGHRGIAARAPENTRAGFRLAAGLGVGCVEFDVQLSADGVPFVFHDDGLERTTDGRGLLVETGAAILSRLDAGRWFSADFTGERIPTLAEVIADLGRLGLDANIEIKADEAHGAETARVALTEARMSWPKDRRPPLLSSFSINALTVAAQVAPDWPRGLLVDGVDGDWRGPVRRLGCVSLHANEAALDRAAVAKVKDAGVILCAYTVNSPERAEQLFTCGVDSVFSDCPERLLGAGARDGMLSS